MSVKGGMEWWRQRRGKGRKDGESKGIGGKKIKYGKKKRGHTFRPSNVSATLAVVGLQTGLLPVWLVFHVATSFRLDIPRAAYLGIFGGYVAQERTRHELLASNVGRKTQNKV